MESVEELASMQAEAILRTPFELQGHKDIKIKPLTIGQMIAINPYLIAIQKEDELEKIAKLSTEQDFEDALKYMQKYMPIMVKVIDVIVGKGKAEKLTPDEVVITFTALVKRMQIKSFLKSIILATGMSLNTKEGIIASQQYITGKD